MEIKITPDQPNFKNKPTVLFIHGWLGFFKLFQTLIDFDMIRRAFKKHHNVNIVEIKWSAKGANIYQDAVFEAPKIGIEVAKFLDDKLGKDLNLWKSLVIIGHSLGSHIAGKEFKLKA